MLKGPWRSFLAKHSNEMIFNYKAKLLCIIKALEPEPQDLGEQMGRCEDSAPQQMGGWSCSERGQWAIPEAGQWRDFKQDIS